jgi:hypothetical protein
MSNALVAMKSTYFSIFAMLFIHSWMNILFFLNKTKSHVYLANELQNLTLPKKILPGVLDIQVAIQGDCDVTNGYYEAPFPDWPGTEEGIYVSPKNYSNKCGFEDCSGITYIPGYRLDSCYTVNKGTFNEANCCTFLVDTIFTETCRTSNSKCQCAEKYAKSNELKINTTIDREIKLLKSVEALKLNEGKKICTKFFTNYTLFDPICEGGVYCFNYICINGLSKCPDYSSLYGFSSMKAIFNFSLNYNSLPCSVLDTSSYAIPIYESKHYLSKIPSKSTGCFFSQIKQYNDDIILIRSESTKEFYTRNGLTAKILDNIDNLTPNPEYKYTSFLNDTLYWSAASHFNLDLQLDKCKVPFLFDKVDDSISYAISIVSGPKSTILFSINLIFLTLVTISNFVLILNINKKSSNKVLLFRMVLFSNLFLLAFNTLEYFLYQNPEDLFQAVKTLNNYSKCFTNKKFVTFLENLKFGIISYDEIFNVSLTKILVENSIIIFMFSLMISPFYNLFTIIGIK